MGAIFFAIWGCVVTAATLVFGMTMRADADLASASNSTLQLPPVYSQTQLLVAPVVTGQKSTGYVFSNVALEMNAKVLAQTTISLDIILQDSYLALIVGNPEFGFPDKPYFELLEFKSGLKTLINKSIGDDLVRAIYVSGVNYLGTDEARKKHTLRTVWLQPPNDAVDAQQ